MSNSPPESAIVVGGGIIGLACAHYLSQSGIRVNVIDKGSIAGACSHANCGYICPSHILPLTEPAALRLAVRSLFRPNAPFRVKPQLDPGMWNWMWQFAKRCNHGQMLRAGKQLQAILDSSMQEYRELIQTEPLSCQWKETGLTYVFRSQAALDDYATTDALMAKEFGVKARLIEGSDLPQFDPAIKDGLAGAFTYDDDAMLRPDQLASEWRSLLEQRGVTFTTECELSSIETMAGETKSLVTSQGKMTADVYVLSMGAWSRKWSRELGCRIPIEPGKGYSVTMSRPDPCPSHPMLFPEHKVGVTPFEDGYRLGSMMEFVGYDTSIPESRIRQLRQSAEPYLVSPHTADVRETWFGWRPMTWDSLPIIGPVPKNRNAFLATGHNMLGMSLATATGRLIAEMVRGEPTHLDAAPYSPMRFQ